MTSDAVFQPMLAMLALTGAVWVYLYIQRIPYMLKHKIDANKVRTPEMIAAQITGPASYSAHNFKNLFEMPVLFYVICFLAFLTNSVTDLTLYLAWAFVGFRAIHSVIQCSYNDVNHRFAAYLFASIALWAMLFQVGLAML